MRRKGIEHFVIAARRGMIGGLMYSALVLILDVVLRIPLFPHIIFISLIIGGIHGILQEKYKINIPVDVDVKVFKSKSIDEYLYIGEKIRMKASLISFLCGFPLVVSTGTIRGLIAVA